VVGLHPVHVCAAPSVAPCLLLLPSEALGPGPCVFCVAHILTAGMVVTSVVHNWPWPQLYCNLPGICASLSMLVSAGYGSLPKVACYDR
jgi:hypothetical protein